MENQQEDLLFEIHRCSVTFMMQIEGLTIFTRKPTIDVNNVSEDDTVDRKLRIG